jgi:hypothetical protein
MSVTLARTLLALCQATVDNSTIDRIVGKPLRSQTPELQIINAFISTH